MLEPLVAEYVPATIRITSAPDKTEISLHLIASANTSRADGMFFDFPYISFGSAEDMVTYKVVSLSEDGRNLVLEKVQ